MRSCLHCRDRISPLARVDVRYCSGRCRVAAHRRRRQALPAELTTRPRWVRWDRSKRPITISGSAASSTDSRTWATYSEATASTVGAGIGFVLDGDGIVCLDLDHCLDGDRLAPWAAELLAVLPPTYVEVSPSGDGLHVWGTGHLERGRRLSFRGGPVEVYGSARYLTVTGSRFRNAPAVLADLDDVLALII